MNVNALIQITVFLGVLVALAKPLGWFMAQVLELPAGRAPLGLGRVFGGLERIIYRLCGVQIAPDGTPSRAARGSAVQGPYRARPANDPC
jgi:K+-transporting ATPase ATPase A chain